MPLNPAEIGCSCEYTYVTRGDVPNSLALYYSHAPSFFCLFKMHLEILYMSTPDLPALSTCSLPPSFPRQNGSAL